MSFSAFADWHLAEIAPVCPESFPISALNYSKYDLQASAGNESKNELVVRGQGGGVAVGWTWITEHENCIRHKTCVPADGSAPNA